MKNGFKLVLITLPIAAIGAGILAVVVSNSPPPARVELAERANAVRVVIADTQTIVPSISGFGLVAPVRSFQAITEVGGIVDYVNPALSDGQILPEGAVLIRLSPTDFNLAIAQAQANIRAAEARLEELTIFEANQLAALDIERDALTVTATELTRAETLLSSGAMTEKARDGARAAHLVQSQKVQSIEGALALLPTQRTVQREQIAVYQTTLASARLSLERSELRVPFAARVASHTVEVGQFLKVGQTAATLDGIDKAEVVVQVAMNDLLGLMRAGNDPQTNLLMDPTRMGESLREMGLSAQVRLRLGSTLIIWPGRVERISGGIDLKTGTVGVVVQVDAAYGQSGDDPRPPLTKGLFVEVVLTAPPITGVVLPRVALLDGQLHLASDDNRLRIILARPTLLQGEVALFTGGIEVGSRVVLSTPDPVIDGLLLDPQIDTALIPRLLSEEALR